MARLSRLLGCALVSLAALPALAATITVTNGSDNATTPAAGSLRDAVSKANAGDTIEIGAGVTVKLTADIDVPAAKGNITIQGKNPPDGLSGKPSTIAPEKAGQDPAPTIKLSGNGDTIQHVICDGVSVSSKNTTGVKVSGCEFTGAGSGVALDGTTGTQIGTDADGNKGESNSFKGCTVGVHLTSTTDTTVAHCDFKRTGAGVVGTDDTNIRVTENTIVGKATKTIAGSGVFVTGDSGTIDKNTITPDANQGIGVGVANSPSGTSKGPLQVTGNDVKVKGKAKGIDVKDRKDVTISSSTVEGKSSGPGIHCSIGPDAGTGGTLVVDGCTVTGCAPGISCDLTGASNETCTISNNTVSDCKFDGIDCMAGADGTCGVHGNHVRRCGSGPTGCGMRVGGAGGALLADANVVIDAKRANVRVTNSNGVPFPTICQFETMTLALDKAVGVSVEQGGAARIKSGTFTGSKFAAVFVAAGGSFEATPDVLAALRDPAAKHPGVDLAPSGWGSTGTVGEFDASGNLTITVPAGATDVTVYGAAGQSVAHPVLGPTVTFAEAELPGGGGPAYDELTVCVLQVPLFPDPHDPVKVLGEGIVRIPKTKPSGGAAPFTLSASSLTLTAPIGQDASKEITVTNTTSATQTLIVPNASGNWAVSPSGPVLVPAGMSTQIEILHSAQKAIDEVLKIVLAVQSGSWKRTVTVRGISN